VVGVAHEVVHPVDVELARDERAVRPLAGDEGCHSLGVEPVVTEDLADRAGREQLADIVVVLSGPAVREGFEVVAERAVADVVEQRRGLDAVRALPLDSEVVERAAREVVDAEAVLEPGVVRRGVDELDRPELFDPPEPLDRRCVDEVRGDAVQLDVVVDGVFDRDHAFAFGGSA